MTQKRVKASDVIGNSYYIYTLQSSNNTPSLNSTINITCNVTDVYGQAISGKSITLYQNNTSKGTKTTDSSGNASWNSISMSSAGLQVFKVENSKIEVFVDNKSDVGHTHSQYLTEHQSLSNYVTTDDSRLSDSRTPTSHAHGNLQNNGQVGSTAQASKNVVTDSSGKITTEDKPTIPSASSTTPSADTTSGSVGTGTTWARSNHTHPKSSLYAESSHNHTKSQITDFPSIPSKTSDLQNDSGFLTSHQDISGKIDTAGTGLSKSGTTLNHSNSVTALTTASFKKVKYDGQGHITGTSDVGASDLPSHNHTKSQITDFPTSMTPTSHTHGNLQNNGQVGSTAQANKNVVTDSSGKITTEDKPTIPSKTSDLTNDSGFLTSHQNISGKENISNKVTSISSSSTDTQYPSAKCVYDENDNLWNYVENLDYTQIGGNLVVSDEGIQAQGLEQIINQIISRLMAKSDIDHTHSGYASSSHTHGTWSSTSITNGTLYHNSAIRLCSLRYSRTFSSASANTMYEWGQLIPSGYRPKYMVSGSGNRNGATITIDSDGYVYGRFALAFSSSTDFYYHIMWPY